MKSLQIWVSFLLLATAWHVAAQSITGTITGEVADQSGGKVVGASVTARNLGTNISYKAKTTEAGVYVLPLLPLGNYEVTVESPGLQTFVRSGLELQADDRIRVDAKLNVGGVAEKVTVTAEAPLVESERATVGATFVPADFDRMAIGRDPMNMLALVPGVTAATGYVAANVNGSREGTTDFKVDGTAATITTNGHAAFQPIYEMVEEVVVQTVAYSAEYTRGGSQLSVNTRSGTNEVRGSLYEYFRNNALDANSFINNLQGITAPILRYNLFGGTVGGPVVLPKLYNGHNRTFFMFGYQGTRQRGFGSQTSNVPTQAMRDGNFVGQATIYDPATTRANATGNGFARQVFAQNQIPVSRFDPVALKMLNIGLPLPNQGAGLGNNYVFAGPTSLTDDIFNTRFDHQFSVNSRITVRYVTESQNNQSRTRFPGPAGEGNINATEFTSGGNYNVSAEHTWILRPNLIQTFRFGYFRNTANGWGPGTNEDWPAQLGLRNVGPQTFPAISIAGLSPFGGAGLQNRVPAANYQISDILLHVRGRHTFKFGVEYRRLYDSTYKPGSISGNFTFNTQPTMDPSTQRQGLGFASFMLGIPTTSLTAVYPSDGFTGVWNYWGAFVQDDFRAGRKLTLNLGVRWDLNLPATEGHNRQSNFNLNTLQLDYVGKNGYPSTIYDSNTRNLAPRVGLAYAPFGDNRTAIRAGYGIFFLTQNMLNYQRFTVGPWSQQFTFPSPDNGITFPLTLSQGLPAVDPNSAIVIGANSTMVYVPRQYPDGNMQQWSLNIQRELPGRAMVEAGYVGTKGTHLQGPVQINQVPTRLLGPGNAQLKRPYPTIGTITQFADPFGSSSYHAFQTRLQRRFSHGLTVQAAYTFSKSIDNTSQNNGNGLSFGVTNVQDNGNLRAEKSVSGFDLTHNFVTAFSYELPVGRGRRFLNRGGVLDKVLGGWNLSAFTFLQSGRPLIMATSSNLTGSLDGGSRPNRLANGVLSSDVRNINRWFDPSAFAQPAAFTFGSDSRTEPQLREPGDFHINTMLIKQFRILEKRRLEFRAEANNALNHFNPGTPNTTIGQPGAGTIRSGSAGRSMELALKFYF